LSGRGLCDELITRPEESYRLWCVVVCDLETSRMRRAWPAFGRSDTGKKIFSLCSSLAKHPPILFPLHLQTQPSFANSCAIQKSMFTCLIFPVHTSKLSSNCLKRCRFMKTNRTERILWLGRYFAILTNVATLNDQGKLPHCNCFKITHVPRIMQDPNCKDHWRTSSTFLCK